MEVKIKYMKIRTLAFSAIIVPLLISSGCKITEPDRLALVPWPDQVVMNDGHFKISEKTRVYVSGDERELISTVRYFIERLDQLFGLKLETAHYEGGHGKSRSVILVLDKQLDGPGDEGYILEINPDQVVIKSKTANGIFYGMQTLFQLLHTSTGDKKNQQLCLPALEIIDKPAYEWRGMHLDVSRHFFDKEFIMKYLDILATYKMNVFHWHLTDDQGWRLEIEKYPKLTDLAAWRTDHTDRPWSYEVEITSDPQKNLYGGYYTRDDIREIVGYAAERFITIVPEIEMPGHSQAALTAYPQFSCSGKPYVTPDDIPFEFTDPFCAGNDSTFIFLQDVLTEVMELFPSEYIHIGGDEAKKTPWINCPKCQARMRKEGLDNVDQLQSYFIRRVGSFLENHGRKLIGWDEILEGGLAPGAAVMSWRGEEGGIEAAGHGHKVVMTPSHYLYFNRSQSSPDPGSSGSVLTLHDVYRYDPVPEILTGEDREYVMGVQACLWTENTQTPSRAEYKLLPRLAALSEIAWTTKDNKNWQRFSEQIENQYTFLDRMNASYFIPPPAGLGDRVFYQDQCEVSMECGLKNAQIRYTLDGSDPDESSLLYRGPFTVAENTAITARTFLPSGKRSKPSRGIFRKEPLRDPVPESATLDNGLEYIRYTGSISSLDQFNLLVPAESGITDNFIIPLQPAEDHFGYAFSGMIKIGQEGVYTFYTDSDDGSRLYIHDELLVDNDGIHGANLVAGQIPLAAGYHPIKVLFFEDRYGQHLKVWIEGPGMDKQLITKEYLFH